MKNEAKSFFAKQAWVAGAWAQDVLLAADDAGHWRSVTPGANAQQHAGATPLAGPVLPGVVNAHSHAFQRAIVGLTERAAGGAQSGDDFWSWRDRMYSAANRISPDQLQAIATQLYGELLAGGYTQVCEFQYLHNDINGQPYAEPAEMAMALVRAAQATGIGLTLLPTLYMRSGFGAAGLRDDQRRFASTPDSIVRLLRDVQRQTADDARIQVGVALHSLRAVSPPALQELTEFAKAANLPVHIHIAEQPQEVQDCLAATGQRPIEWLLDHAEVDARWNLVHATHTTSSELAGIAARGAAIVICPSTEANLGDGVFDLPGYSAVQGHWSIGSDSHVTRAWPEELRLLEYGQRLTHRQRNVAARVRGATSTAGTLFEGALRGGQAASGLPLQGLCVGQRADFVVLDTRTDGLLGVPADYALDAAVFSSPVTAFDAVYVAGRQVPPQDHAPFVEAMHSLWA